MVLIGIDPYPYGDAKKEHCGVVMYNVQLHFLLILVISSIEKKV